MDDVNAAMTFPKADKLELMRRASSNVPPVARVFATRSEPARSTNRSTDLARVAGLSTKTDATKWERDESAFMSWDAVRRRSSAVPTIANARAASAARCSDAPSTVTVPSRASLSCNGRGFSATKSRKSS